MDAIKFEPLIAEQHAQRHLQTFFNIMAAWQVSAQQQIQLLGNPSPAVFQSWQKGQHLWFPDETTQRIEAIVEIYRALAALVPFDLEAHQWISEPHQMLHNASALDYMCQGDVDHVAQVHRYLQRQLDNHGKHKLAKLKVNKPH